MQTSLQVEDPSQVGECRRAAQRTAERLGFDATSLGRVGIVTTELANNVLRHAGRGEILIQGLDDGTTSQVEVMAIDSGPGMQDVERCLRDGYSTSGTAGTGLGAIARLSAVFDIYSGVDSGTVVLSRIANFATDASRDSLSGDFEFGAVCIALRGEIDCGDTWRLADGGAEIHLFVADGLGHGTLAANASQAAADVFQANPLEPPADSIRRCHAALSGSRGAAVACGALHRSAGKIHYSGVGNVAGTLLMEERTRGLMSHNGTLGVKLLKVQELEYDCPPGTRIVMHSDGLSARWSLSTYPGLALRHCAVIAGVLYRDQRRIRDDVTVLIVSTRH